MDNLNKYEQEFLDQGKKLFSEIHEGCESEIAYMLSFSLNLTMQKYSLDFFEVKTEIFQAILNALEHEVSDELEKGVPSYNDFIIEVVEQYISISPKEFGGLQTLRTCDASDNITVQEKTRSFTEKKSAIDFDSEMSIRVDFSQQIYDASKASDIKGAYE